MAARKSKPRKSHRKAPARKPARRPSKAARKPVAKRAAKPRSAAAAKPAQGSALAAFARKIVRATQDPSFSDWRAFYADGAVSREATGHVATGWAELEAKLAGWNAMQEHTVWKARQVFADGDSICIEWDATVHTRDGRIVPLAEVAIHQVRDGKIVAERFYYNPATLAPPS